MDGGPWWAAVHGVAKSQTRLSNFTFTFHFHALEKEMATHSILVVRNPSTSAGSTDLISGLERPSEEGNGNHSNILASAIPWTEEPGGLQSIGLQRVGHDLVIQQANKWFYSILIYIYTDMA